MGSGDVGHDARLETSEVCNGGPSGKFNSRGPSCWWPRQKWSLKVSAAHKKPPKGGKIKNMDAQYQF